MSKRILIDCDGVLTEHNRLNLERLNEEFGSDYDYEQIKTFDYDFMSDEEREYIYEECWSDPTLYDDMELDSEARVAIDWMRDKGWRPIAVSSPMVGHIESKYRFLKKYFDREDIVLTRAKDLINGDLLIDDGPHNIERFPNDAWVFDRPWNRDVRAPRVHNWEHVITKLITRYRDDPQ